MGSRDRRERERLETREKILDAASELFVRDGVEAVTMRAIAERIEYTPTAIYHHFKDKTHLLYACCEEHMRFLAKEIQQLGQVNDPVERIRALGLAYAEFGIRYPNHYRFMFMTPMPELDPTLFVPDVGNPEVDAYAALVQAVEAAIAAGRFRPEYADAQLTAQMLWSGIHGIVSLWMTKGHQSFVDWRDERTVVRLTIDTLTRGMLTDPAALAPTATQKAARTKKRTATI